MRTIRSFAVVLGLSTISSIAVAQSAPTSPAAPASATTAKKPPPPPPPADQRVPTKAPHFDARAYEQIVLATSPTKDRFARGIDAAKKVSARVTDPDAIAKKAGLDTAALRAAVKAVLAERDTKKRAELHADLSKKFGPKVASARALTALQAPAQGAKVALDPRARKVEDGYVPDLLQGDKGSAVFTGGTLVQEGLEGEPTRQNASAPPPPPPPTPPTPATPATIVKGFLPPFTSAWTKNPGPLRSGAANNGAIDIDTPTLEFAGADQTIGAITQDLQVDPGVRKATAYAVVTGRYQLWVNAVGGYASSEAILNLRVLEGGKVLCSDRVSLQRKVGVVFAVDDDWYPHDFSKVLACEATRTTPSDGGAMTVEVDGELWVGCGANAGANAWLSGGLGRIDVRLDR